MPPLWTLAYLWGHPCTGRRSRALSQFRGLSSWASSPPPCNWLWQPHTWQRWGRWRGSSVHRCADLQQREAQGEGQESPRATDSWSRSVSQQICHQCPCHLESTWWLGSCTQGTICRSVVNPGQHLPASSASVRCVRLLGLVLSYRADTNYREVLNLFLK